MMAIQLGKEIVQSPNNYFGGKVKVDKVLFRRRIGSKKEWLQKGIKPRVGIIIGVRRLRNGRVYFYEDHIEWNPDGDPIPCILVAFSPRENPVKVPLDGVCDEIYR